jgi:peptide/nickel transport system substrate-binding protein
LAAVGALVCAAAALAATSHHAAGSTLVIDNSFTIKTSDPQRAFDPTASIVDRAIYDTLFTYRRSDLAHPVPLLVSSWKASNGGKKFVFQLKKNVHFANGNPLTSADVVFSLNRLINLKGNPSFLLATRAKAHEYTVADDAHADDPASRDPGEPVDRDRQLEAGQGARWERRLERGDDRQG